MSGTLDEEVTNRENADHELQKKLLELQKNLLGLVPLGTIFPWVNKPSKDSVHAEDPPVGWVFCDGREIEEGVWKGDKTPDLLSSGKFLRGGTVNEILNMEDAMLLDHTHIDPGHAHKDGGHTHR